MKISLPIIVSSVRTMADGGNKITLETPILQPDELALVFSLANQQAVCVLASEGSRIDEKDFEVAKDFPEEKSPQKRLRDVIYILWKQRGEKGDFELYYRTAMERLINKIKSELNV